MKEYLADIVRKILGSSPEDALKASLETCINLTGAKGGSILGEEGPYLQFLFSNVEGLIGQRVPHNSIAGTAISKGCVIYTYAPGDKRHFDGIDSSLKQETRYLLSIPIPNVMSNRNREGSQRMSGAIQLLFDDDILNASQNGGLPKEFSPGEFANQPGFAERFENLVMLLPIIQFGMEVMNLRKTSYQVIHELKNKMIGAHSWLNYLHDDMEAAQPGIVKDQVKDDLDLATTAMQEGSELAKSYLQFTKIYSPNFQDINLNDVLSEVSASAGAVGSTLGGEVQVEFVPDKAVPIRSMDPGLLKMAFFNLCKNAVEALITFKTPQAKVTIQSSVKGKDVEVMVKDNGPGMPQEIADSLFIPFKTKKEGGTGLGLAITKKIVDIHGGDIRCETGPQGTAFIVRL